MVLQQTIENLRERPKDERRAVALSIALGVVAVLFLGWIVFFVRGVQTVSDVTQTKTSEVAQQAGDTYTDFSQNASAAASVPDDSAQVMELPSEQGVIIVQ